MTVHTLLAKFAYLQIKGELVLNLDSWSADLLAEFARW